MQAQSAFWGGQNTNAPLHLRGTEGRRGKGGGAFKRLGPLRALLPAPALGVKTARPGRPGPPHAGEDRELPPLLPGSPSAAQATALLQRPPPACGPQGAAGSQRGLSLPGAAPRPSRGASGAQALLRRRGTSPPPQPAAGPPPPPQTHLRQPRRPGKGRAGAAGSRAAGRGWRRSCSARSRSPCPGRRGCRRGAAPAAGACCPCRGGVGRCSGAEGSRAARRGRRGSGALASAPSSAGAAPPPPRPGAPDLSGGASAPPAAPRAWGAGREGAAEQPLTRGRAAPAAALAAGHKTAPHVTPLPSGAG